MSVMDGIIIAVLLMWLTAVLIYLHRRKRKGCMGCCDACSHGCSCSRQERQ